MHLVAYSNLNNLNLFSKQYAKPTKPVIEKFISKKKKGAKNKRGRSKDPKNCLEKDY